MTPLEVSQGIARFREKFFGTVRETAAHPRLERHAQAVVEWAAAHLGITPPRVAFCVGDDMVPGMLAAYSRKRHTMWLRTDLSRSELAHAALHEICHALHAARGGPDTEAAVEGDARVLLTRLPRELR